MGWIFSRKVKIYNGEWVEHKNKTVYYRPTVVKKCDFKLIWTGEKQILLNISRGRKGQIVHLITYNILLNFTHAFTQGSTIRGFLSAYN